MARRDELTIFTDHLRDVPRDRCVSGFDDRPYALLLERASFWPHRD